MNKTYKNFFSEKFICLAINIYKYYHILKFMISIKLKSLIITKSSIE